MTDPWATPDPATLPVRGPISSPGQLPGRDAWQVPSAPAPSDVERQATFAPPGTPTSDNLTPNNPPAPAPPPYPTHPDGYHVPGPRFSTGVPPSQREPRFSEDRPGVRGPTTAALVTLVAAILAGWLALAIASVAVWGSGAPGWAIILYLVLRALLMSMVGIVGAAVTIFLVRRRVNGWIPVAVTLVLMIAIVAHAIVTVT